MITGGYFTVELLGAAGAGCGSLQLQGAGGLSEAALGNSMDPLYDFPNGLIAYDILADDH